jgi:hypothetical protein
VRGTQSSFKGAIWSGCGFESHQRHTTIFNLTEGKTMPDLKENQIIVNGKICSYIDEQNAFTIENIVITLKDMAEMAELAKRIMLKNISQYQTGIVFFRKVGKN